MASSRPSSAGRTSSGSYSNRYAWLDESMPVAGPSRGLKEPRAKDSASADGEAGGGLARRKRPKGEQWASSGSVSKASQRPGLKTYHSATPAVNAERERLSPGGLYTDTNAQSLSDGRYPHSAAAELFSSQRSPIAPANTNHTASFAGSANGRDPLLRSDLPPLARKTTYSSLPPSPDASQLERALLPGLLLPSRDGPPQRPLSTSGLELDADALDRELALLGRARDAGGGGEQERDEREPSVDGVDERLRFRATSLPPESYIALVHAPRHENGHERPDPDIHLTDSDDEVYQDVEVADWSMGADATAAAVELLTPRIHDKDKLHALPLLPAMERTPSSFRRKSPARPQIVRAQTSARVSGSAGHNLLHRFNSHTGRLGSQAVKSASQRTVESDEKPLRDKTEQVTEVAVQPPRRSFSLWEMLMEDVEDGGEQDYLIDGKWDRISNFLAIPLAIEKVTLLGSLFCLDGLLYNFTVLPIRVTFAIFSFWRDLLWFRRIRMPPIAQVQVIMKALLLVVPTVVLLFATDMSKMYHGVRGQDTIKLYVIFNVLEIADRLCCAFGQDIMDTLFAKATLDPEVWRKTVPASGKTNAKQERIRGRKRERARPFFFFFLALAYVHLHAIVSLYQLVSLNVAINSYDNALLTLLVSNQFVEIKGSVFKKFDKENLFQITCADIVERFQLALMLSVIAVRNMVEMSGSDFAFLPQSFIRGTNLIETIWSPVLVVIFCEMLVDWLKHGFITKFNHVRASCYERYSDVLCKDVMIAAGYGRLGPDRETRRRHASFVDQSPLVTRRLGFASIPLSCLVIRTTGQGLYNIYQSLSAEDSDILSSIASDAGALPAGDALSRIGVLVLKWGGFALGVVIAWICLVALKMTLGIQLLRHSSSRMTGMEVREAADRINDFGRSAIGDSEREKAYAKAVTQHLNDAVDDLPPYPPMVKRDEIQRDLAAPKGQRPKWRLEDVERWTMIKRIF